jgi:hypothetical protein
VSLKQHQNNRRALAVFSAGALSVSLFAIWVYPGIGSLHPENVLAREDSPTSTQPTVLDLEDRSAYSLFARLTHATASAGPRWNHWRTKQGVGLPGDGSGMKPNASQDSDLSAMEFPTQIIHSFNESSNRLDTQNGLLRGFLGRPELASVLFNPQAAQSIIDRRLFSKRRIQQISNMLDASLLVGEDRHLPDGSFKEGSIVVKLIWELIPSDDRAFISFYDANDQQFADDNGQSLNSVDRWQTYYSVNFNALSKCTYPQPSSSSKTKILPISINCFYFRRIRKNDTAAWNELSNDAKEIVLNETASPGSEDAYAVLMGVHVMRLTPQRPQWEWMTFYWTNQDNHQGWKGPWRFFNMKSTDALRNQAFKPHQAAYNPYLEGTSEDGLNANCLNCHSLAAYGGNASLAKAVDLAKYDLVPDARQATEIDYFTGAVQTGFIWSLSESQSESERAEHQAFAKGLLDIAKVKPAKQEILQRPTNSDRP